MKLVSFENLLKYNELLNQKTVKSVNSVKPDSTGNVTLGTEKSTFNKVVYDTGYFSISPAQTYNFDLTGTDLENVSKDNINIRLVAKVTTAHNGFEVGDIAQLTTAIDFGATSGNLDVCTYIRGNTLYIYSGNNTSLSVSTGTAHLDRRKAQIKAVLTAFIPDDGSILLIAEDQTNTSKLIGLPDGTLTWQDKNIVRSVNGVNADENGNVSITSVANATKATQDSAGNVITDTYVKKTGDIMTGALGFSSYGYIYETTNDKELSLVGGNGWDKGAGLALYGKDSTKNPGGFLLGTRLSNSSNGYQLLGTREGLLQWNNKNLVRSVNGVNADAQGNVVIKDLVNIIRKNDGNDYYDDSDITSLIYAGNGAGTIRNEIANGNFARVHPGQTIKGRVTGTTYIVVGCNIYKNLGDTELTTNHIGLMPIQLVGNEDNLLWSGRTYAGSGVNNTIQGYAPWASDNETEGKNQTSCYKDSYIANTVLPKVDNLWLKPDFENQGISVLTFRSLDGNSFDTNAVCMSNPNWRGCATRWAWASRRLVLPSEPEIYGHYAWAGSSFESGSQHTQLPLYRHKEIHKVYPRIYIWLKDSVNASGVCSVYDFGAATHDIASRVLRVCPLFLIA